MGKVYNAAPSYNQPRHGAELLHGNEVLRRLATERLHMLNEAKQRAEAAANAIIAMHGVMPSADQAEHFTPRNVVDATERFEARRQPVQETDHPELSSASQQVIHAENRFSMNNQVPMAVQPSQSPEALQRPETSFDALSVEKSRATVDQIFAEITQARQEWHAQTQDNAPQEWRTQGRSDSTEELRNAA